MLPVGTTHVKAGQDDAIWDAPVAEIGVKFGLQVFQHVPPLQWEKTPVEFVEVI